MENLEQKIKSLADSNNKISCKDALKLATELDVNPGIIGKEASRLKIKIKGCQLGCF